MLKPRNRERQVMMRSEVIERALVIAAGTLPTVSKPNGITVADIHTGFPGSRVIKPEPATKMPPSQLRMLESKVSS